LEDAEIEKSKAFIIMDSVAYVQNSINSKTIISKLTGTINAVAFDSGEALEEIPSPFDAFIQVIDGSAEILINDHSYPVESGNSIILPAHARTLVKANAHFKMISIVLKSEYDR
jgi:quercetin dioxygenase-like cupin family protein